MTLFQISGDSVKTVNEGSSGVFTLVYTGVDKIEDGFLSAEWDDTWRLSEYATGRGQTFYPGDTIDFNFSAHDNNYDDGDFSGDVKFSFTSPGVSSSQVATARF
jgi:hypothetical protein